MTPRDAMSNEPLDHEVITKVLEQWLAPRLEGTGPVRLGSLEKPGSGLSAGTLLFEAHRAEGRRDLTYELVVRIPPPKDRALFPHGDLDRELETQNVLAEAGVPVAPVVGVETDPELLGGPFLVTRRVSGRLVDSSDPYLSSGWLHDSAPEFQMHLARDFFRVFADIHRVERSQVDRLHVDGVERLQVDGAGPPEGRTGIGAALDRWTWYLDWADEEQSAPGELREALRWCADNRPLLEPVQTLLWGDAQLANAVFADDGSTAAILDFELSALGPAELDLGWFFCLHDMTVARCGEDLPGFVDRAGLIAGYEERLGRPVTDLAWYEVFGAVCTASILVRMSSLLCRTGMDARWLARSNPALDYLTSKLS